MKKRWSLLAMAVMTAAALTACGGEKQAGGGPSAAEPESAASGGEKSGAASVVLKLGHIQSESDLWHQGAEKFAEEVEALSGGDMRVEIYPNSTLGGDRDMAEGMMMGTVDMALIAGVLSNFDDQISVLEIPYLFRNEEEFEKIIYGDIGSQIAEHVRESSGIRILDWWERGPRLITSSKPINSVEDMKGLKIRIPEINAMEQVFSAWGAAATTMSWSEVYPSLQQGVIEAQENPVPFFYSGSIYEVNKYIANTNHKYEYVTMAMSDAVYQKLTPEQQEILGKAAAAATQFENDATASVTKENLKDMVDNHGVTVTDPDTSGFISIADEVAPKYAESIGQTELYNRIQETLGR